MIPAALDLAGKDMEDKDIPDICPAPPRED